MYQPYKKRNKYCQQQGAYMKKTLTIIFVLSNLMLAQKSSMDISGMKLKLGMSKEAFNNEIISANFTIDNSDPKTGSLTVKENKIYGRVYFDERNRVCNIAKECIFDWKNKSVYDVISIIYDVLQNGTDKKTANKAILLLDERNEPEINSKNITIGIGDIWSISITSSTFTGENGSQIYSVTEIIGELPKHLIKKYGP